YEQCVQRVLPGPASWVSSANGANGGTYFFSDCIAILWDEERDLFPSVIPSLDARALFPFWQSESSSTYVALAFSDSPDTLERTSISNGAVGCFVSVDALYEQRVHRMLSWSASWVSPANGGNAGTEYLAVCIAILWDEERDLFPRITASLDAQALFF
ncbi:hypothetical protein TGGT1_409510, partial [Toxoplasma gondii GT1]